MFALDYSGFMNVEIKGLEEQYKLALWQAIEMKVRVNGYFWFAT